MTEPALRAEHLYRFYHTGDEETLALRGVSLAIERGELVAVIGPSGSGKSTLLACLAGLDDPDGGAVWVDGRRVSRRPEAERASIRQHSIGMLFQSTNLIESLTVRQNLALIQQLHGRRPTSGDRLLERLGIAARAHAYPDQLSGGELVRAGLAAALVNTPPVLLADEPTGEVDSVTEQQVLSIIRDLVGSGLAAVLVTHSTAVAQAADRILRIDAGQLAA